MLSKEEALYFVTEVLGIASPLEKIAQDPYQFLKEYMPAFHVKIPFQSADFLAVDLPLRHRCVSVLAAGMKISFLKHQALCQPTDHLLGNHWVLV
jgi:hypothetical protein